MYREAISVKRLSLLVAGNLLWWQRSAMLSSGVLLSGVAKAGHASGVRTPPLRPEDIPGRAPQ